MNLAERYPPTRGIGSSLFDPCAVMCLVPYSVGCRLRRSLSTIYKDLGDVWGQGQSLNLLGVVLYVGSRYDECIEKCREAVRLLERTGDFWEVTWPGVHIGNSLYRKGDLVRAISRIAEASCTNLAVRWETMKHPGLQSSMSGHGRRAGECRPNCPDANCNVERNDVQVTAQVMLAEGVRLFGIVAMTRVRLRRPSSTPRISRGRLA